MRYSCENVISFRIFHMVSIIFGQIAAKLFSKKQTKQFEYGSHLQPNLDITPHMAITARVTRELSRE